MYLADTTVLSKGHHPDFYDYMERMSVLAKRLYNAALFRLRQAYTGWEREARTANEKAVFEEIRVMQAKYPRVKVSRVLSYRALDAVMRANGNPDFFAGLPMQTAQRVLKEAADVFGAWQSALKEYGRRPWKFTGRPRMPKYLKGDRHTFYITNQDAVLYPARVGGSSAAGAELKLPRIRERLCLPHLPEGSVLKEVQVRPYYGKYMLVLVLEKAGKPLRTDLPHMAGIDLGTVNIAAIVSTDHSSRVYKGGAVLSENRSFHKKKAEAVGIITRGTRHRHADSAHLRRLSLRHDCFMRDMMHKISADIVRYCTEHGVGTVVIGASKGWKQGTDMGKENNQNFVSIPHDRLRKMILYKAGNAGIRVVLQEESYTSKADISAMDPMPVYGREDGTPSFSGRRVRRGLYACSGGYRINADCSGAANILRKAFPGAWEGTEDFRFLAYPETAGWKELQRGRRA